jgi:hypothetical protein
MAIHWSYKSLPELSALSDGERKEAWKKAVWRAYERWQLWLATAIVWLLVVIVCFWIGSTVGHEFVGLVVASGLSSAITDRIIFRVARSHLKATVAHADGKQG